MSQHNLLWSTLLLRKAFVPLFVYPIPASLQIEPVAGPPASVVNETPTAALIEPETQQAIQRDLAVTKVDEPMEQDESEPVIQEESVDTVSQVK